MNRKTDDEIIAMVRRGGGSAFTGLACVIRDKTPYPGNIDDVFALLADAEPISFGCSPSDLAQAYLIHNGNLLESDVAPSRYARELLEYYDDPDEPRPGFTRSLE